VHADAVRQLEQLVNAPNTSDSGVLGAVNRVLSELDRRIETLDEAPAMRDRLGSEIESDPRAAQLARLKSFASVVTRPSNVDALTRACQGLLEALKELRVQLTGAVALARLDILEAALRHFGDETRGPVDLCPLCGQRFVGDLRQHVAEELERLERLRSLQQLVKTQQRASRGEIDKVLAVGVADLARSSEADSLGLGTPFEALSEGLAQLADALDRTRVLSQKAPEKWGDEDVLRMAELLAEAAAMSARASELRASLATAIEERSVELDDRGVRTCMVRARDLIRDILDTQGRIDLSKRRADGLATLCEVSDRVADEYVAASNADVERRFSAISTDVDRYFSVLEAGTPGLAGPALRLVQDRDRAVILEIEFRGERIDHAHGYLSQSQLNSFGLAVFLASARIANNTFPFLVLDDVINSFDAYKRPRLAELLRTDFSDFQLLVLTHDHLWWDRLARECPSWVRLRFTRYEPGSGPIYKEGVSSVEEIGAFIDEDRPDLAGRSLGPLMELELQELAEAFEALVPYNRRNEYTLDPLLDRLRVRAKEKLGASHPFHVALSQMQEATSFRNFAAHWKNPESPITAPEMREVFDRWGDIRSMARCPESGCGLLAYDRNSGSFICSCRKTALVRHT
jgi:hypothetical protein